ncbi:hypothetical protein B0H19DRAFT_1066095 [Mycena capillaripes]|nr:hypothetical protein B0H19DRAFT_1066095 [Mycena capillaripes]
MSNYTSFNFSEPDSLTPRRFKESELPRVPRIDRTVIRPGIGVWTPLCIIGGTVAVALLGILHHIFDTHFNGRRVSGFWTQTKTSQLEILLATAFKIVFCFSAGISLCQVAPATLLITTIILASPLITVFAPSLTVRQASAVNHTLTVPTLNLPLGWTIPDGCAPECHYNITYFAPAVRCSDLAPDQISDAATDVLRLVPRVFQHPPAAHLINYKTIIVNALVNAIVNFTTNDTSTGSAYSWTFAYLPFAASNADNGTLINAAGSACTFYNATHEAETHFFNGTQQSSVSVVEFHDTLTRVPAEHLFHEGGNISAPVVGTPGVVFAPGLDDPIHFLAIADALRGSGGDTLILETNLFEAPDSFKISTGRFTGLNSSSSITHMSQALENLVANMSLSFIHTGTGFINVDALVPSTDTIYVYNRTTLAATYLAVLAFLLAISSFGMFCLIENGEPSSSSFSQLLMATRNAKLDPVADIIEADEKSTGSIRLMFGEVDVPGRGVRAAFGLVSEQNVEMLRRRRSALAARCAKQPVQSPNAAALRRSRHLAVTILITSDSNLTGTGLAHVKSVSHPLIETGQSFTVTRARLSDDIPKVERADISKKRVELVMQNNVLLIRAIQMEAEMVATLVFNWPKFHPE